jgi:NAD(P)H dehydrogenase (quinone)
MAAGFAEAVRHPVRMEVVPRDTWEALFRSQGMKHPLSRIRMLDGFNEGWIDFEGNGVEHRIDPQSRLDSLIAAWNRSSLRSYS